MVIATFNLKFKKPVVLLSWDNRLFYITSSTILTYSSTNFSNVIISTTPVGGNSNLF
jgi:hypothetical protein